MAFQVISGELIKNKVWSTFIALPFSVIVGQKKQRLNDSHTPTLTDRTGYSDKY